MSLWSLYDRPAQVIPFTLNGHAGSVSVYHGQDDDPIRAGFDTIPSLGFDIALCRGYPVMHARIETFEGSGYSTLCGWIQIVTDLFYRPQDPDRQAPERSVSVDLLPTMQGAGVPFVTFGHLPQVFDAPCRNLGQYAELRWIADTFLATVPLRRRQEEVSWLLGFRWGYIEHDNPVQQPVSLLPLEVTDASVWNGHLAFLEKEFESWRFKRASIGEAE